MQGMTNNRQLPTLTSLRFFAAFAVLVRHAVEIFRLDSLFGWSSYERSLSGLGAAAVPFFYALSGFVLCYRWGEGGGKRRQAKVLGAPFRPRGPAILSQPPARRAAFLQWPRGGRLAAKEGGKLFLANLFFLQSLDPSSAWFQSAVVVGVE